MSAIVEERGASFKICSDLENDPSLSEESFDQLSDLYATIQSLDDAHRIPLILKYVKGFSEKEIAQILSLNQNTVKSRLFKGRKRLKEQLNPTGKEDSVNERFRQASKR